MTLLVSTCTLWLASVNKWIVYFLFNEAVIGMFVKWKGLDFRRVIFFILFFFSLVKLLSALSAKYGNKLTLSSAKQWLFFSTFISAKYSKKKTSSVVCLTMIFCSWLCFCFRYETTFYTNLNDVWFYIQCFCFRYKTTFCTALSDVWFYIQCFCFHCETTFYAAFKDAWFYK